MRYAIVILIILSRKMATVTNNRSKIAKNEQVLLEDDDDFEEFPTEGKSVMGVSAVMRGNGVFIDWTAADEDGEDAQMWEDNWDDDNVEDDFSTQLRSHHYNTYLFIVPLLRAWH